MSAAHRDTGLVPFLLSGMGGECSWEVYEFDDPVDISGLGGVDVGAVLDRGWRGLVGPDDEDWGEQVMRAS